MVDPSSSFISQECVGHRTIAIDLIDSCFLTAEFLGSDRNLTVEEARVCDQNHLVKESLNICRAVLESLSVVEHDGESDDSTRVIHSVLHHLHDWGHTPPLSKLIPHLELLKGAEIVLLDNVAMMTLLNGVVLVLVCCQSAEHVPSLVVVRDHGLVPEAVVVDKPVGLHGGVEDQVGAEDVDVLAGEEHDRVNSDLSAEEEVFFIAASLNTPGIDRDYVDQTVTIPIDIFIDGCCKDSCDYRQEDRLHGSVRRINIRGSIYTEFHSFQVWNKLSGVNSSHYSIYYSIERW